ncbi:citrate lyase holo-[acyl-carrier protein] synthase [Lactobacillus agrestimuris]|uniref:citrate lyase holo-[acyl-carrier protein] synthase n=1 Tax=Lactobacillus agrestimuris TaxID=2941328 RepID=UPI0019C53CBD|nr:citrate lyase holo-[acyl-carrier protein] synthase [Lactobacillus agrestimuris]MBD5431014.1 citrate lyase holo-[acyl-carrier protein] synthase [Lactobacillus sp.]
MKSIFETGKKESIQDVLEGKDRRVEFQQKVFAAYPEQILVDIKMNIPGPIKNNQFIKRLYDTGIKNFETLLNNSKIDFQLIKELNKASGPENFYLMNTTDIQVIKKISIKFEDTTSLGRLFDADVLSANRTDALSRKDLNLPVRKCFICNRPAKECARSRRHSVKELQDYISGIYWKYFC